MNTELSMVLAGGGCRAFWTLGMLDVLLPELGPVREFSAVSASSAMVLCNLSGTAEEVITRFERLTAENRKNVYPEHLFTREPLFPHERMYRSAIVGVWDEAAMARIRDASPVRILQAFVEPGRPVWPTIFGAVRAYSRAKNKKNGGGLQRSDTPPKGIGWTVTVAQDIVREIGTPDALADEVLMSSASPPITQVWRRDGRTYVDGGAVDNVPLRALTSEAQAGRVLTLLTRFNERGAERPLVDTPDRLIIGPSRPTPVDKFDYTQPELIRETFELGREDARRCGERIVTFARR
jgi:predicted acylesterase/phospholipase RssA